MTAKTAFSKELTSSFLLHTNCQCWRMRDYWLTSPLLTLSDNDSSSWAIYYFVKMSPWAQSPYLAMLNWWDFVSVWVNVIGREREGGWNVEGKIRNESKFSVASRLTSSGGFTSQGFNTFHYAAMLQSNDVRWPLGCRAGANRCKTLFCYVVNTRNGVKLQNNEFRSSKKNKKMTC